MRYTVVVEMGDNGFKAYAPDLPDCVATGKTKEGAVQNLREVIKSHLEKMKEQGLDNPETSESK